MIQIFYHGPCLQCHHTLKWQNGALVTNAEGQYYCNKWGEMVAGRGGGPGGRNGRWSGNCYTYKTIAWQIITTTKTHKKEITAQRWCGAPIKSWLLLLLLIKLPANVLGKAAKDGLCVLGPAIRADRTPGSRIQLGPALTVRAMQRLNQQMEDPPARK